MLDKDKKIIVFNFYPTRLIGPDFTFQRAQEAYTDLCEALRAGFDDSIKLISLFRIVDDGSPILEVVGEKLREELDAEIEKELKETIKNINDKKE